MTVSVNSWSLDQSWYWRQTRMREDSSPQSNLCGTDERSLQRSIAPPETQT